VAISVVAEIVFLAPLELSDNWSWQLCLAGLSPSSSSAQSWTVLPDTITVKALGKSYHDKVVFKNLSLTLAAGGRYVINSPSGTGKTTLLRVLAGLEHGDSGSVVNTNQAAMVFQETRLFERRSAVDNLRLAAGRYASMAQIRSVLCCLLPEDSLELPVFHLSGGMQRRVELCRALLMPSQLLLLDEPFAGLDHANSAMAQELLLSMLDGRTLVVVSHDLEDIEPLAAMVISPISG
jgi:ABC-type nitrate/sulfonate/bicarbonate transport system ATPase subunit